MFSNPRKKVLIAGGSGFIGSYLADFLSQEGFSVSVLSRYPKKSKYKTYTWEPNKNQIDKRAITENNYIINLAGAGIADKLWSKKRKKEIIDSRIHSTRLLINCVLKYNPEIIKFISASAIGFYGNRPDEILDESCPLGEGFLANLCNKWEGEALKLCEKDISINILRIGVVLSDRNGFLPKIKKSTQTGLNVLMGQGKQKVSWIHIEDLLNMFLFLIYANTKNTVYNAVAPECVSLEYMQSSIAKKFSRRTITLRIPSKIVKTIFGDFSEVFLNDQMVIPYAFLEERFNFKYPDLKNALDSE